MKNFLIAICLIVTSLAFAQGKPLTKAQVTEAVQTALKSSDGKDYPERISEELIAQIMQLIPKTKAELSESAKPNPQLERLVLAVRKIIEDEKEKEKKEEAKKDIKKSELQEAQFDTIVDKAKYKGHRKKLLKKEAVDHFLVSKYIELDVQEKEEKTKAYTNARATYENDKTQKNYDAMMAANPYKVYYGTMNSKAYLSTYTTNWTPTVSLVTIPFKIFPSTKNTKSQSNGDLDNVGAYLTVHDWKWERFYADEKETKRALGGGVFGAPSVVELDADNTGIADYKDRNHVYFSVGVAGSFTYGNFTVMLIPLGFDIALSESAKAWKYDGHYWWGFGLGVDTALFNF